jgi:hypothetical protein
MAVLLFCARPFGSLLLGRGEHGGTTPLATLGFGERHAAREVVLAAPFWVVYDVAGRCGQRQAASVSTSDPECTRSCTTVATGAGFAEPGTTRLRFLAENRKTS